MAWECVAGEMFLLAVKEFQVDDYCHQEILLFTVDPYWGNLFWVP